MLLEIFVSISTVLALLYWYLTKNYGKYSARGITEESAAFPLGSKHVWDLFMGKSGFIDAYDYIYSKFSNDKFIVSWEMNTPITIIRDLELSKHILVKDFDHFVDRRPLKLDEKSNIYFLKSLVFQEGDEWKLFRSILSPIFTSGKLKSMTIPMHKVGDDLVEFISGKLDTPIDNRDINIRFGTNVIASCVFGFETECFANTENNKFYQSSLILSGNVSSSMLRILEFSIIFSMPKLAKLLKLTFTDKNATEFIVNCLKSTLEERRNNDTNRNDLTDMLNRELENATKDSKLSEEEREILIYSNAFIFFFAGFSTTTTISSVAAHYLAKNPEMQQQLFNEISEAVDSNDGNQHLDYNTIQSLTYLEMVFNESLRIYPLGPLERKCVKDYPVPDSNHVIKNGEIVVVLSPSIMKDEKYYENAQQFCPDNFSPDRKKERNPFSFMPFGHGPRNCIGYRFAALQFKINIIRLVYNFEIVPCEKTAEKLIPSKTSMDGAPEGGSWLMYKKRSVA